MKKLEKPLPLYLVYVSHQGRIGQPRTNWRRGLLQKAATTRDICVVHMCASLVPLFTISSRWDHEKANLVYRRSPDRGGILVPTSSKKTEKNDFLHSYEYASRVLVRTTCVIYMQKFHLTRTLLFILTWGGVWCRFLVLLGTHA